MVNDTCSKVESEALRRPNWSNFSLFDLNGFRLDEVVFLLDPLGALAQASVVNVSLLAAVTHRVRRLEFVIVQRVLIEIWLLGSSL